MVAATVGPKERTVFQGGGGGAVFEDYAEGLLGVLVVESREGGW